MNYLDKVLYVAEVDKNDTLIGKVERWEAHKKGILHRAFTLVIRYQDQLLVQHRKHPVFNGFLDVTISSHPIYIDDTLQDMKEAIYATLKREWYIQKTDLLKEPIHEGTIYYQAQDPGSEYQEHEMCHVYSCEVSALTLPNFECCYGFTLHSLDEIKNESSSFHPLLAPWVKEMISQGKL